MKVIYQCHDLF